MVDLHSYILSCPVKMDWTIVNDHMLGGTLWWKNFKACKLHNYKFSHIIIGQLTLEDSKFQEFCRFSQKLKTFILKIVRLCNYTAYYVLAHPQNNIV